MASGIDYPAITQRQQQTWATGDFHEIARQIMWVSEELIRSVDPHAGQRVLDVACGSGNAALIAARRYCEVAGVDYVPALLGRARERARAEDTPIDFRLADAQSLPFADATFDVVLSVFGVMFAPDQATAASELLRVCKSGGRIGLCNWTPDEFGGEFFDAHARYSPPPPNLEPPSRWGTEQGLTELLGAGTTSIACERAKVIEYYRSIEHGVEIFARYFGSTRHVLDSLDAARQEAFRRDLATVFERYNVADDGTLALEAVYMRAIAIRNDGA